MRVPVFGKLAVVASFHAVLLLPCPPEHSSDKHELLASGCCAADAREQNTVNEYFSEPSRRKYMMVYYIILYYIISYYSHSDVSCKRPNAKPWTTTGRPRRIVNWGPGHLDLRDGPRPLFFFLSA